MNDRSPFDSERDRELGSLLREALSGPDPARFSARLSSTLAALPARGSQWDVLAGWARPSVLVAAAAAGFALGLALWQGWRERLTRTPDTSVAVAILEPTRQVFEPIIYTVLEEQR
jgi:hypothetical protein